MTVLTLPLPPLANRYWRLGKGHLYRSSEATAYKQAVASTLMRAGLKCESGPVIVTVRVYRKRKAGDLDGYLKVLLDALQGVAYENDRQIVQIIASLEPIDKDHPHVAVGIAQAVAA